MRLYLAGTKIDVDTPNIDLLAPYLEPYSHEEAAGAGAAGAAGLESPEIKVTVSEEDIAAQRELTQRELLKRESSGSGPTDSSQDSHVISDLAHEFTALYKKILYSLVEHKIIYLHGSLMAVNGNGYLFMAPSGTGKSTHTRLWREVYGDKVKMINDDKPLFRIVEGGSIWAYGSPWNGKHGLGCNECVPLRAIVRLRRGQENRISELDKSSALKLLLLSTLRFEDAWRTELMLEVVCRIIEGVRFYDLECNMEPEAARTSYERLVGDQ